MDNEHNTNLLDYGSLLDSQFDNEIDPQIEDEPNYLVDE